MDLADGICEDGESFCIVGLGNCLTEVSEIIEKKNKSNSPKKSIYISKVSVSLKVHGCSYRTGSSQKPQNSVQVLPPTDLNAHQIQPILEEFENNFGPA